MKATEDTYKQLKYFKITEKWGDPLQMNSDLLFLLDSYREYINKPVIIHCGYSPGVGHVPNSQHYLGNAVDFHVVGASLLEQYLAAERFDFTGIGVYPYWVTPGLHVDVREVKSFSFGARWYCDKDGVYKPLTAEVIKSL
jgi:hypothetical protein